MLLKHKNRVLKVIGGTLRRGVQHVVARDTQTGSDVLLTQTAAALAMITMTRELEANAQRVAEAAFTRWQKPMS